MKRFLLSFLGSTLVMIGIVYFTVIVPGNVKTSILEEETVTPPTEINPGPTNESYLERMTKGDTLFESEHFLLASVEYQLAAQLEPTVSEPYFRLGQAQFYGEKYPKAVESFQKTIELDPTNEPAQIFLGKSYLQVEQFKNAQDLFEGLPFENTEAFYYRGVLNAYMGNYESATLNLNKVIERGDFPDLSQNATNYLNSMSEYTLAEDPDPAYPKTLIGRSLAETQENRLAITLLYDVLRDAPDYRDAWIILGYAYLNENKFPEAQNALFKAVELDPTKAESRYFLGLSYFGLGDYPATVTQLELALQSGYEPKVQAYQKLGDAAVLAQNYAKATEAYEKVLILNSSDIELFVRPVWLNIEHLKKPQRALEIAEQAIREHPGDAMSYNLAGWAQMTLKQMDKAEKNLRYALIIDPSLAAAHYNLGLWNELQNHPDEAQASFKQAYTLDPGGPIGNLAAEKYNQIIVSP